MLKTMRVKTVRHKTHVHTPVPEYVDWLDEKGNVIGEVEKGFAHRHGIRHPAVHIFVFTSKNELILQHRAKTLPFYPDHWDTSVGGHVVAGEKIETGARREVVEELSVHVTPIFLGTIELDDNSGGFNHREEVFFYYAKLPPRATIKPNEEFQEMRLVSIEKIPPFLRGKKVTPLLSSALKKFHNQLTGVVNAHG